jgi:hypothetical protein
MAECEPKPRRGPDWLKSWRFWRWVGLAVTVISAAITVWRFFKE